MSLKRSHAAGKSFGGAGGDGGAGKIDRQDLFDELKRLCATGQGFTPVDVALTIGSSESLVAKTFLGLAVEGLLERLEGGKYRATPLAEVSQAEFVKALARASHVDSTRQRDLSEIGRLKQNNDTMRQRLLAAIAERDHYLSVLRSHGIEPGQVPEAAVAAAAPTASTTTTPAAAAPVSHPATPDSAAREPSHADSASSEPGGAPSSPT